MSSVKPNSKGREEKAIEVGVRSRIGCVGTCTVGSTFEMFPWATLTIAIKKVVFRSSTIAAF